MNEMITIPRAEYDRLIAAAEDLDDIRVYDKAMAALASGDDEAIPSEFVDRILDGEAPLRVFRDWRGLTQTALAERAGVNRVQIANIEAGTRAGSAATLQKLATALGLTVDDLL